MNAAEYKPVGTRRSFLASLIGSAFLSVVGAVKRPERSGPPNFVIFLADDLGYGDLGCYGNRAFATPRLDGMAAEGARLTEFYAMPTCTPARAALLTGRYPLRSGLVRVLYPREHFGVPGGEILLPQALKPAGYRTACIGKWHLGDLPQYRPTRHGFDFFYGLLYSNDMTLAFNFPRLRLYRNDEIIESPVNQATLTQRYTEQAIQFIELNRDRPFLLYLPYSMPHVPISASQQFRGKSHYSPYGDAVEEIDWSVGQVLDCLKKNALDEHTLAFFSSDNGPKLNTRHPAGSAGILRGGKSTSWEGGIRVPCIARWPKQVPPHTVRPGISCLMDIFTTCVELSGARLPDERPIDGKNLMPFLQNASLELHSEFFYYFGAHLCALRAEQWKLHLMKRDYDATRKPGPLIKCHPPELYDLRNDPGETSDVSAQHAGLVESLQALASDFEAAIQAGKLPHSHLRSLLPRIHRKQTRH
ncbi:MAG: sulfatase [Chlamydiota bacterium]